MLIHYQWRSSKGDESQKKGTRIEKHDWKEKSLEDTLFLSSNFFHTNTPWTVLELLLSRSVQPLSYNFSSYRRTHKDVWARETWEKVCWLDGLISGKQSSRKAGDQGWWGRSWHEPEASLGLKHSCNWCKPLDWVWIWTDAWLPMTTAAPTIWGYFFSCGYIFSLVDWREYFIWSGWCDYWDIFWVFQEWPCAAGIGLFFILTAVVFLIS